MEGLYFNTSDPVLTFPELKNKTLDFYSSDSDDVYRFNSKKMGPSWKWANRKIEYKFNSFGYRSKNIQDLDKDFVLGFGCSFTEGVGIDYNDIWLTKFCNYYNIDCFNMAKAATGIDIQYYNAVMWKNSKLPLPKLVVVQWPQKFRKSFGFQTDNGILLNDMSETPTKDGNWWGRRYIIDTGEMSLNTAMWYAGFNNVWECLGVPVLNFTWEDDMNHEVDFLGQNLIHISPSGAGSQQARDLQHDGPEFHEETLEQLIDLKAL